MLIIDGQVITSRAIADGTVEIGGIEYTLHLANDGHILYATSGGVVSGGVGSGGAGSSPPPLPTQT